MCSRGTSVRVIILQASSELLLQFNFGRRLRTKKTWSFTSATELVALLGTLCVSASIHPSGRSYLRLPHVSISSPKKAHKHKEMGPQNWTLDPTPKTPLDPPPRNSLCTVFCWEKQHLHKELGRLNPLLDPSARVPPKFFMQIFFGCFFRS